MADATVPMVSGRMWRSELIATLLLGLAAVGAGWAAYQSARWGSEMTFALDNANRLRRDTALLHNKAYLLRAVDVSMYTAYAQAITRGDKAFANFLFDRFRPPMKTAVRAWLAAEPLKNPSAPPSPFVMKEYRLQEDAEAQRLQVEEEQTISKARREDEISDNYVLLTVPFAIVSLFSGLSTKFWSPGIRTAIVAMATAAFLIAVAALALMPVS